MENRNPGALFIGGKMQNGATAITKIVPFLNKLKVELPLASNNPTSGYIPLKELTVECPENICTPVFTVALPTAATGWKRPKCP